MTELEFRKYVVIRNFVGTDVRQLIYEYTILKRNTGQLRAPDERVATAQRMYADPITEALLAQKLANIETAVGAPLHPTYSYLRIHPRGAAMAPHRDRRASEIGVTINIGGDAKWPIWIKPGSDSVAVDLAPGDALLYLGRMMLHWREPFEGTVQVQAMLFYVRRDGDCASCVYDGRAGLGFPSAESKRS
jgi:hypothetical protein